METYTDEKIKKIVTQYKNKRARESKKYHEELKLDPEWRAKNCEKSREFYKNNKEHYKDKYNKNKEYIKIRNLYRYYLNNNKVNDFKNKYPEKYEYLKNAGYNVNQEELKNKPLTEWFIPKEAENNIGGLE
tara:strand:- start:189 stop:581 length:393 start_codon:yes stop_codon:yes gene_type:complete